MKKINYICVLKSYTQTYLFKIIMKKKRKVCVVINNRANYARIKSVLNLIKKSRKLTLQIICGSSSLLDKYGSLDKVIEKDKFNINRKIHFLLEGDSPNIMAKSTGLAINELSNIFDQIKPNICLLYTSPSPRDDR